MRVGAIVLAAGYSQRFGGRPKALLPWGPRTFVRSVVETLGQAGVSPLVVVVQAELHEAVLAALEPGSSGLEEEPSFGKAGQLRVVVNPQPELGMLASLRTGLEALQTLQPTSGALLHLVDHPGLDQATVRSLLDLHRLHPTSIVLPVRASGAPSERGRRRGHPVLFPASTYPELHSADPSQGARAVVWRDPGRVLEVPVAEAGPFVDIDTPELYKQAHQAWFGFAPEIDDTPLHPE